MILEIDFASDRPLYRLISDAIYRAIVSGELGVGDRLPPGRELAASLDVNLETVQRAYRLLADEGIVTSRVGRGTRVASAPDPATQEITDQIQRLIDSAKAQGIDGQALLDLIQRQMD